ncbi:MAG: restriction endonuclease [Candidatus Brocadiaceae bacterium]|nr:restriction endonuclease [Candidatus Brocadiaceae bacterium]
MARKNETILNLLAQTPWWVSVILSITTYVVLKFIVPAINFQNWVLKVIAGAAPQVAIILALVLFIPAPISFFNSLRKRKLLDKQKGLNSIKSLSWKELEELVAEAYRRKGYSVIENYGIGPDGGVDLVLKKDGNLFLVQCKQWRSYKVDVRVVREMYGVMTAKQANGVMIITSGLFTQEAKNFAADKPIDLVEGNQLAVLIGTVQSKQVYSLIEINETQKTINLCPDCGGELVLRVARHGINAGNKFGVCSNFPKCKYTKTYAG